MRKTPRSEDEYAEMAASVEAGEYTAVPGTAVVSPQLTKGRPVGGVRRGKSPVRNVRLPEQMDALVTSTAEAEGITPSELIRAAVSEYLARHSV